MASVEFVLKQAYINKINTCLNNANMTNGINLNELIDRVSDADVINKCWTILTQFNNFNQNAFIQDLSNNCLLIKEDGKDMLEIILTWINLLNKTFIKIFKQYLNSLTGKAVKGKIDKTYIFELKLRQKYPDKSVAFCEEDVVELFNQVFKKKAKSIKNLEKSSGIDIWKLVKIDNDKTTEDQIFFKLI